MEIILMLPILFFSVVAHEFAHGYIAYLCGDATAKIHGRLTFNPIAHIDMFGTIIFPVLLVLSNAPVLFGWAKPVPVNVGLLRKPHRHHIYVSLAGIGANLLLAVFCTVLYGFYILIAKPHTQDNIWLLVCNYGIQINVILAVFNIMPVPPLDGSWVLYRLLPKSAAMYYKRIFPYGFLILIVLLMTGMLQNIITPLRALVLAVLSAILRTILL